MSVPTNSIELFTVARDVLRPQGQPLELHPVRAVHVGLDCRLFSKSDGFDAYGILANSGPIYGPETDRIYVGVVKGTAIDGKPIVVLI